MKQILPLDIWSDGDTKTAIAVSLYISYDDLSTQAALVYKLHDNTGSIIYEGQIFFTGQEYIDWGSSGDSNEEAYVLAASHLNITLV
jgi:alanine-alpha-ketoisovalerate/valine-pyruvate aminotransferase